jgi:hypothetical protein
MENSTDSKKGSADNKESNKPKKHRAPKEFGALAIVSEQELKAGRSLEKPAPTGHVGKAALLAEAKPARRAKPAPEAVDGTAGKNVETVARAELLRLSEHVIIDGSSLRQIYETHLVGEHGLRRLMAEHIRGGDLKKVLRREIVERQIDFERDPAVRDMTIPAQLDAGSNSSAVNDSGKAALAKLLKQTDLAIEGRSEETAFFKARAIYEANQLQQHRQRRRIIDITVAALIFLLLVLVFALYMGRA